MKILKNKYINYLLILIIGIIIGKIIFSHSTHDNKHLSDKVEKEHSTIWTCSMHPQIRIQEPGKCPICGMDLIPLNQLSKNEESNTDLLVLSEDVINIANVQTSKVKKEKAIYEIQLYGKVMVDERRIQSQAAHVSGRIEKLFVSFTGQYIEKGELLALIYSPELISAQQELLEAIKVKDALPQLYTAAYEKLKLLKLTDAQIENIKKTGQIQYNLGIVSNTTGIVINKLINEGDYVNKGSIMFQVADLSNVWVVFDAYEADLPYIHTGSTISFTIKSLPENVFTGKISYIDPVIDPITRVVRIRVEMPNPGYILKPEMSATGVVQSIYTNKEQLIVPRSAVLWTGTRSIVWVKIPEQIEPTFTMREIKLGPAVKNGYIVLEGLNEGEEVVTEGTFEIDAAAQLEGKPSMINKFENSHNLNHYH